MPLTQLIGATLVGMAAASADAPAAPAKCTVEPKVAEKLVEVSAASRLPPARHLPASQDIPEWPPKAAFGGSTSTSANQIVAVCPTLEVDRQGEPGPGLRFPRKGTIPST
jgi:hypothetical protein